MSSSTEGAPTEDCCDYSTAGEGENAKVSLTVSFEAVGNPFTGEACGNDDDLDFDVDDFVGKAFVLLNEPAAAVGAADAEEADDSWADELMVFLDDGAASPVSVAATLSAEQLAHRRERNRARLCRLRKEEMMGQLVARLGSLESLSCKLDEELRAINVVNHILEEGIRTRNSTSEEEAGHEAKRPKTLDATGVFEVPPSRCFSMKLVVGDSSDALSLITVHL
ncbi:hypothetical protein T492DRAFT_1131102 [Pavlovales sp. CCMP2436]|nr:hypothetical protein T492DRAFT_1131102 [Pavlovales sp. CCMP2436]